jgi:hypothetical protein
MDIAETRQLRLNFLISEIKLRAKLILKGLIVTIESDEIESLEQYLSNQQFSLNFSFEGKRSFTVSKFKHFLRAANQVELVLSDELKILARLIEYKSEKKSPVYLTLDSPLDLNINFSHKGILWNDHLPLDLLPAFMSLEIPYRASMELLEVIRNYNTYPYTIGRAYRDMDDYLRIDTISPQFLEEARLPGLFKVGELSYGIALSYQDELESVKGIIVEYKDFKITNEEKIKLPYELSEHSSNRLKEFEEKLLVNKSQVVVWGKGLGRRVFCLAVMESLENYPLLIVSQASGVWAWKRHISMIGRSGSLTSSDFDIQIVTYDDIKRGVAINSPRAIIYDDVEKVIKDKELLKALRIMDGVMDAYRIGCCNGFPTDSQDQNNVMSLIKPFEFSNEVAIIDRYPLNSELAFKQHIQPYILKSENGLSSKSAKTFKKSIVEVVEYDDIFLKKIDKMLENSDISFDLLSRLMECISAGTDEEISPKIVKVLEIIRKEEISATSSTIICTRFERTQRVLGMLLSSLSPEMLSMENFGSRKNNKIAIIKFDEILPELHGYDNVIIVDYPWSFSVIEKAVGAADNKKGCLNVSIIHLKNSIDDRLAIFAARRSEVTLLGIDYNQPNFSEVKYILSNLNL